MDASTSRSNPRLHILPAKQTDSAPIVDELKVARRRMRHLAPWNVKPVPMMHLAHSQSSEPTVSYPTERTKQVALKVLAVHMSQAAATGHLS